MGLNDCKLGALPGSGYGVLSRDKRYVELYDSRGTRGKFTAPFLTDSIQNIGGGKILIISEVNEKARTARHTILDVETRAIKMTRVSI